MSAVLHPRHVAPLRQAALDPSCGGQFDNGDAVLRRQRVERMLTGYHGFDTAALTTLDKDDRELLRRIALRPSRRDALIRRNAVTALGLLADDKSVAVLVALASDRELDPVIVGRALLALAVVGGPLAVYVIERGGDERRRAYVQMLAMWAAVHASEPALGGLVLRALHEYPSNTVRRRAHAWLVSRGIEAPEPETMSRPKQHRIDQRELCAEPQNAP